MMNDDAGRHPHELLSAWLDGELGDAERALVAAHLERCAGCGVLLDDLRLLATGIAAEEPPSPPADLAARIGRRLGARPGSANVIPMRRPLWRSPLMLAAVAAALAGIMVTVVWFSARPVAMRQDKNVVVAQAPAPSGEPDRLMMFSASETERSAGDQAASDRDDRGEADEAPSIIGEGKMMRKAAADVAVDRVPAPSQQPTAGLAPPPPAKSTIAGKENSGADAIDVAGREEAREAPIRIAETLADEAVTSAPGDRDDRLASSVMAVAPGRSVAAAGDDAAREEQVGGGKAEGGSAASSTAKSVTAMALLDSVAPAGTARDEVSVVAPPLSRSLELLNGDYHAILSEDGALTFRAAAYECAVPAGSVARETEIEAIFAQAAAEQSRRAAAATSEEGEPPGTRSEPAKGTLQFARSVSPEVVTFRDTNGTTLYREERIADQDESGASPAAPVALRLDRLIRERYLPLMESACGPPPVDLERRE